MVPSYLKAYEDLYVKDPHKAALAWFENAKYGLFIHYGLYTLLGRGEWAMFHEKIHVAEYEKLTKDFTAENFDAEKIADFAVRCKMKYISFVTEHHDGFCMFNSKETDFNTYQTIGRDFVKELAVACEKRGLGLFLYYTYALNWRHPYFFDSASSGLSFARPNYNEPEPAYLYKNKEDFKIYWTYVHNQIKELLTNYAFVAGMWFDIISAAYFKPDFFPVKESYDLIRSLQPQCLVSFKQGVTGDEDYMSQELVFVPLAHRLEKMGASQDIIDRSTRAWEKNRSKHNEICTIMQDKHWAYNKDAKHKSAEEVLSILATAQEQNCNVLMNIGPLPDGNIHPEDYKALLKAGKIIEKLGFDGLASYKSERKKTDTGANAE